MAETIRVIRASNSCNKKIKQMENNKLQQDHHKLSAAQQEEKTQYLAGRGAQLNTKNRFLKDEKTHEHIEGIDDWEASNIATQYIEMQSKTIVNKVVTVEKMYNTTFCEVKTSVKII